MPSNVSTDDKKRPKQEKSSSQSFEDARFGKFKEDLFDPSFAASSWRALGAIGAFLALPLLALEHFGAFARSNGLAEGGEARKLHK